MKELKTYKRLFSPETDDFNDKAVADAAYARALALPVETVDELEKFVEAWMDVSESVREQESRQRREEQRRRQSAYGSRATVLHLESGPHALTVLWSRV